MKCNKVLQRVFIFFLSKWKTNEVPAGLTAAATLRTEAAIWMELERSPKGYRSGNHVSHSSAKTRVEALRNV
jgi:hypothetical protein